MTGKSNYQHDRARETGLSASEEAIVHSQNNSGITMTREVHMDVAERNSDDLPPYAPNHNFGRV